MNVSSHGNGVNENAALIAQLDTGPECADAWHRLTAAAEEFATRPHAEDDAHWQRGTSRADGVVTVGHPVYGPRVQRACQALSEVGAVTPAYHWTQHRPPALPEDGSPLAPADAIRLATTLIRGEPYCDGTLAQAVEHGTLQAVLASLADWHRNRPPG